METLILFAVLLNIALTLKGLRKTPEVAKKSVSTPVSNLPTSSGSPATNCIKCGRNVVRYDKNGLCANCANGNL